MDPSSAKRCVLVCVGFLVAVALVLASLIAKVQDHDGSPSLSEKQLTAKEISERNFLRERLASRFPNR